MRAGETLVEHANKKSEEFIVAMSGSFDILLDNGKEKKTFSLNRPDYGLYIPNMLWMAINNFSTNAVLLIIASSEYNANDYFYNYDEFISSINE